METLKELAERLDGLKAQMDQGRIGRAQFEGELFACHERLIEAAKIAGELRDIKCPAWEFPKLSRLWEKTKEAK